MVCLCLSQGQAVNLDALVGVTLAALIVIAILFVYIMRQIIPLILLIASAILNKWKLIKMRTTQ